MSATSVPSPQETYGEPAAGAALAALRAAWGAIAVVAVVVFAASLLAYHGQVLDLEAPGLVDPYNRMLAGAELQDALAALGLSAGWFAVYAVAMGASFAIASIGVGVLLFWRRSREPVTLAISLWLVLLGATFTPLTAALPGRFPGLVGLAEVLSSTAFFGFFLLFYLFPDGRFVPGWTRWAVLLFVTMIGVGSVAPGSVLDADTWGAWGGLLHAALVGSMIHAQIHRYRRASTPLQRQQTKWVAVALVAALLLFLVVGMVGELPWVSASPASTLLYDLVGGTIVFLGFVLIPIAIGFAMLRRRLWDVDVIIGRALVYLALSGFLVAAYVGIVSAWASVFQAGRGVVALLATATVAVAFAPLRERLQRIVNRWTYGERDDPYAILARLGTHLELELDPREILPTILRTVVAALRLPHASMDLRQGDLQLGATVGTTPARPAAPPLVLPLVHEGRSLGSMVVSHREGEADFSSGERRLLRDFARQAAVAARAVILREETHRLADDLQRSRERLVAAREEERRRLRRELHDGLGAALASQMLVLDAARRLLPSQPATAEDLLAQLSCQMQDAVQEIRRVVHDLRPPALDQLGLLGALREHVYRMTGESMQVTLRAGPLSPVPAAVEVAAFRIAVEATVNAARHADARVCEVAIELERGEAPWRLILTVDDDGRGLPTGYREGVGHQAMRDRAAELGGTCTVRTLPGGGTRVEAVLPVTVEEP